MKTFPASVLPAFLLLLCAGAPLTVQAQISWEPTNGPAGASVQELRVDESGRLLAGTLGGGVFSSTDRGNTWTALNNGLEDIDILALANADLGRLYAGTNNGRFYMSDNDGLSWTEATPPGLPDVHTVAAGSSGGLFAGGSGGLQRSMDGGATWGQLEIGFPQLVVIQTMISLERGVLLMGTLGMGGGRSTDNGTTWAPTPAGPPDNIIFSYAAAENGDLFAGTGIGVYRSMDEGLSWTELADPPNAAVVAFAIDSSGTSFAATSSGVFISTNSGLSWLEANSGLPNHSILSLVVGPDGAVYAGTDGDGVYRSEISTDVRLIEEELPGGFALHQNYPNPFNPVTTFQFSIANSQLTILRVYDLLGREIATPVNEKLGPGSYTRTWDASGMPSGVYFYRLHAIQTESGSVEQFVQTKKLIILR